VTRLTAVLTATEVNERELTDLPNGRNDRRNRLCETSLNMTAEATDQKVGVSNTSGRAESGAMSSSS